MTTHLQKLIHHLVHADQTGFLKGRSIAKNFIYATELVQCSLVLKLDFRKAFNTVDWGALDAALTAKGFPERWHAWVRQLNLSSQTSILLNGVPGPWFQCRKGLRLRDPLSPYLFIGGGHSTTFTVGSLGCGPPASPVVPRPALPRVTIRR